MDKSLTMARAALGLPLLAAGLVALVSTAHAQATPPLPRGADRAPDAVRPVIGAWDFEMVGQPRKCTITFAADEIPNGRQLRYPAICRRALPVLHQVVSWSATPSGLPRLNDALGKPVIEFASAGTEKGLQGKTADGQQYTLDPKGYPRSARRAPSSPAEIASQTAQRPTAIDPSRAPTPETLPGRYAMMRQQNREACKITLSPGPVAADGRAPAAFEGLCPDTGLTIFDPAGWRYQAGRLTLVARKGHGVDLVFENGQWRKDPAVGAPLLLKKLAP